MSETMGTESDVGNYRALGALAWGGLLDEMVTL